MNYVLFQLSEIAFEKLNNTQMRIVISTWINISIHSYLLFILDFELFSDIFFVEHLSRTLKAPFTTNLTTRFIENSCFLSSIPQPY